MDMMETKKDSELVEEVKAGSDLAYEELYKRYAKLIYFIAQKSCKNDADSKDVVQDTFIEMKRSIQSLKNPEVFRYWITKIALSKCKNLFRKNKTITYDDEHYEAKNHLVEERGYLLPKEAARFQSDQEVLLHLIDQLPIPQKQVVLLFYLEQYSIEEIAILLDTPVGTIKSRLNYARTSLKSDVEMYERKEHIKLNFHSLGEGITASLGAAYAGTALPTSILPSIVSSILLRKPKLPASALLGTTAIKACVIVCTVGLAVGGGAMLYHQQNPSEIEKPIVLRKEQINAEEPIDFPSLHVMGVDITSPRTAYFHLKTWVCCEEEANAMSKHELEEIHLVYQAMKDSDCGYYQDLVKEGWASKFEEMYAIKK